MAAIVIRHRVPSMHVPACCRPSASGARCQNTHMKMVTMEQPLVQRLKTRRLRFRNDVLKSPMSINLSVLALPELRSRIPHFIRAGAEATGIQGIAVPPEGDLEKLIEETKFRLGAEYADLTVGRGGRDDEGLLVWFLKDRKYDVEAAVTKVGQIYCIHPPFNILPSSLAEESRVRAFPSLPQACAQRWRSEFGVDGITPEMIAAEVASGKAALHPYPDVTGQPVIIVTAANHIGTKDPVPSQRLCVSLVEEALSRLPPGQDHFLGIFDLRGFGPKNADLDWVKFFVDIFFNYYPKRLSAVLFVDAPFVFQPGWALIKPLLKSYAHLVKFVSAEEVATHYFTPETLPDSFKRKG